MSATLTELQDVANKATVLIAELTTQVRAGDVEPEAVAKAIGWELPRLACAINNLRDVTNT